MRLKTATIVGRILGLLLVWAGIANSQLLMLVNELTRLDLSSGTTHWEVSYGKTPGILCIALLLAGIGILVRWSIGYFLLYLATIVSLLFSYHVTPYLPLSVPASLELGFGGRSMQGFFFVENIAFTASAAWTHYELRRAKQLNQPIYISHSNLGRILIGGTIATGLLTFAPFIGLVCAFVDSHNNSFSKMGLAGLPLSIFSAIAFCSLLYALRKQYTMRENSQTASTVCSVAMGAVAIVPLISFLLAIAVGGGGEGAILAFIVLVLYGPVSIIGVAAFWASHRQSKSTTIVQRHHSGHQNNSHDSPKPKIDSDDSP